MLDSGTTPSLGWSVHGLVPPASLTLFHLAPLPNPCVGWTQQALPQCWQAQDVAQGSQRTAMCWPALLVSCRKCNLRYICEALGLAQETCASSSWALDCSQRLQQLLQHLQDIAVTISALLFLWTSRHHRIGLPNYMPKRTLLGICSTEQNGKYF